MDTSFYTAAQGARARQTQMNVIANNIANVNTDGYRAQEVVFSDLMYYNMHPQGQENWRAGAGSVIERTSSSHQQGNIVETGEQKNFAIAGSGYFMLLDPSTNEVTYTRDGVFEASKQSNGEFYLVSNTGKYVLGRDQKPIVVKDGAVDKKTVGVFDFQITTGMLFKGENEMQATPINGDPYLVENPDIRQGCAESSNVDIGEQMSKVIESSRSYSYVLKMLQTSDEIEQAINGLR